ncbi:MAG TPA: hypothetical protein VGB88_14210 [Alphaproteobacteria bacterium]
MTLDSGQALRRELLLKLLEVCEQPEVALAAARRMEAFILGRPSAGPDAQEAASAEEGAGVEGDAYLARVLGPVTEKTDQPSLRAPSTGWPGHTAAPSTASPISRRRWIDRFDRLLREQWDRGVPVAEIAARLDRTTASINGRVRVLGLAKRRGNTAQGKGTRPGKNDARNSGGGLSGGGRKAAGAKAPRPRSCAPDTPDRPAKAAEGKLIAEFIAMHGVRREPVTIDSVVKFLQSRGHCVVRSGQGRFELDNREHLSARELLVRANIAKQRMRQPKFPDSVLRSAGSAEEVA